MAAPSAVYHACPSTGVFIRDCDGVHAVCLPVPIQRWLASSLGAMLKAYNRAYPSASSITLSLGIRTYANVEPWLFRFVHRTWFVDCKSFTGHASDIV